MDIGLIVSIAAALAAAEALSLFRRPETTAGGPTDAALWAGVIGVAVGRMTALALDDPGALGALRDLTALRGGVEFWPGLAAGVVVLAVAARREGVRVERRLGDLAPYGLMAAAGYQATCFVREGCFGPAVGFGISPGTGHEPVLPVEVVGAVVLIGLAAVFVSQRTHVAPMLMVAVATWSLAVQRAVVSFWLPAVGEGLTRVHRESIAMSVLGALALVALARRSQLRRGSTAVMTR